MACVYIARSCCTSLLLGDKRGAARGKGGRECQRQQAKERQAGRARANPRGRKGSDRSLLLCVCIYAGPVTIVIAALPLAWLCSSARRSAVIHSFFFFLIPCGKVYVCCAADRNAPACAARPGSVPRRMMVVLCSSR